MELAGKRVLVTGADGFIGSHLVESLVEKGADVTGLSQYNSFNSWGWLDHLPCLDQIKIVTGDVRDSHFCSTVTKKMEIVFHLAALIPIPYSYLAPESYVDTNVKGTLHLCRSALENGVSRFIQTSTSEVYGTARYVPMDELHPLNAQSPYSATKIASDAIAISFFHSFGLPVVIARPFNTYGPRQSARAVIPTIMAQIISGKTEIGLGDVRTTRDFTFVRDTCAGFLAIAGMENGFGEVFNIGSNTEIAIGELLPLIAEIMGVNVLATSEPDRVRPETSELRRLCCDNTKLKLATGFEPAVTLRKGIERTAEWMRCASNFTKYKPSLYNI